MHKTHQPLQRPEGFLVATRRPFAIKQVLAATKNSFRRQKAYGRSRVNFYMYANKVFHMEQEQFENWHFKRITISPISVAFFFFFR